VRSAVAAFVLTTSSCRETPTAVPIEAGTTLVLTTIALPALGPAREGHYEAWVIDGAGRAFSAGTFEPTGEVVLVSPVGDVRNFEVTVEPPGDSDALRSPLRLLRGVFRFGSAELAIAGAVTQGDLPLRETPGTFTMFSPSDNSWAGYPSHEESGVWLFNVRPRETPQNDAWVRLTQLQPGGRTRVDGA
jgi:hypothetical protein